MTTTTRLKLTLLLPAMAALTGTCAMAQDAAGWYGGASAGRSLARIDDARITAGLLAGGYATGSIADDDRATGYKLYGGYRVNPYFALEGGYFSLGRFGYKATTVPPGTFSGDMRVRGLNLDLVGIVPVGEHLEVFGRVGAAYAQTRDHFSGTGAVSVNNANAHKSDTNLKVGLGVGWQFNETLGMRLEAERYRINDAVGNKGDVDLVSLGLVWRFGPKAQALAPRAAYVPPREPAAVPAELVAVAPPPPAPAIVVAPVAPPASKVTFSADALFDFDKSQILPEGRRSLDQFARDLSGTGYASVRVTGHTDRLGPHAYNLKLSARRAEAVGSYLATSGGIPASKITTRGVDGAEPVTRSGDCPGRRATPALIACLQPDRRVEVETTR